MPAELHGTELSHTGVESMKTMHVSSILLLAAGLALTPVSADARGPKAPASDHSFSGATRSDFCAGYARAAIDQVKRASLGACGYPGPRWTSAIREHEQWCLRQNHVSAPKAEDAARDAGLRNCKAPAVSTPLFR